MVDINKLFFKIEDLDNPDIIFVSDLFVEDYVGGAELTTDALIKALPNNLKIKKIKCKDITEKTIKTYETKFWIFGNYSYLIYNNLLNTISQILNYAVLEYDYKFCIERSQEKHKLSTGYKCNCAQQPIGNLVSNFLANAKAIFWMSELQKQIHEKELLINEFDLKNHKNSIVLSSIFTKSTIELLNTLKIKYTNSVKNKWIVLGSNSWVKGADAAIKYCQENNLEYEVLWNLPYELFLEKLASSKGVVYLPNGPDTCPRMIIESKLLGCELILNDYVQHKNEDWFNTLDINKTIDYILSRPDYFWNNIQNCIKNLHSVSGYITVYNCIQQKYPFVSSINSLLKFCDEVCIVDGGSTDGTWEKLLELQSCNNKIKIKKIPRNWTEDGHSLYDGMQKAEARRMCSSNFCWQMDSDEIVHENDCNKIKSLIKKYPLIVKILSLPVIEYWGSYEKVRCDITPWKWRLSRNLISITHGVPKELRTSVNGQLRSLPGSDGCDMVDSKSYERLQHLSFVTNESETNRLLGLQGNKDCLLKYENWFNDVVNNIPCVFHYSWIDLKRKLFLYKNYWTKHWLDIEGKKYNDTKETNYMFDVPWSEVTEEMIEKRAIELSNIGGWIWHQKWNGQQTPWIKCNRTPPTTIEE